MKKYKYIFIIIFIASISKSQNNAKRDKIDELRVTFITHKVNLSSQEAQQFWPLYNELNDKLENLKKTFRINYLKNLNAELLTDKEADALLTAEFNLKQKEIDLNKEYYEKYKKILPIKKIALIRMAENEFKKELIKNIKGSSPE
ncbi:MAG: hypothetical protein ACK504_06715 [Bacteroidota bacterium]